MQAILAHINDVFYISDLYSHPPPLIFYNILCSLCTFVDSILNRSCRSPDPVISQNFITDVVSNFLRSWHTSFICSSDGGEKPP